jgi:uncharacterized membrane protein
MSKSIKIVVGLLTLLPLVGTIFYLWFFFRMFTSIVTNADAPDAIAMGDNFASFFSMLLFMMAFNIGLLIFYIVHVVKNKALTSDERLMWILLFIFISFISFGIYWALKIWGEADKTMPEGSDKI